VGTHVERIFPTGHFADRRDRRAQGGKLGGQTNILYVIDWIEIFLAARQRNLDIELTKS